MGTTKKEPVSEFFSVHIMLFQTLDEWSFDVFALHEASAGQPVKYLGYELLNRYGMIHKFKVRLVKT